MKKILVTGGAGFIGSHTVEKLIEAGHKPIVLDDFSTGKKINLSPKTKVYEMDIRDDGIKEIFAREKFDAVCHLAAKTGVPKSVARPIDDVEVNVRGLVNVLENCKNFKIKKFVFASTGGALYGNAKTLPTPEDYPTRPLSPYGIDKLTGEHYLRYYNQVYGLPVTILRYSNIYGPRQDRKGEGGVVYLFITQIMKGQPPTINGTGKQTRDFLYVADVARANVLALEQKTKELQICNISTGRQTSVKKLFEILAKKINPKIKPIFGPALKGEINRSYLKNDRAKKELSWKPKYNLQQGIVKTIAYFREFM